MYHKSESYKNIDKKTNKKSKRNKGNIQKKNTCVVLYCTILQYNILL